jgi:hypothetical protein
VELREVDELLADTHLRVQASLLGHVADPPPDVLVDRTTAPPNLAAVGRQQTDDDPHRGRLAGPVRADEPDTSPSETENVRPSRARMSPYRLPRSISSALWSAFRAPRIETLATIPQMTEPLAVEQQLEEIGARLAWVRDYL